MHSVRGIFRQETEYWFRVKLSLDFSFDVTSSSDNASPTRKRVHMNVHESVWTLFFF